MKIARRLAYCLVVGFVAGIFSVGCHAQVPPNPTGTTYTCPAATGAAYSPLNQSSPATGLAYADTKPAAGTYCYVAQADASGGLVSLPSNIAGPFTTSGTNSVDLTWTAPTSGATPTGYVISRVVATATTTTVNAPTLGATVAALRTEKPEMAKGAPVGLNGSVGR